MKRAAAGLVTFLWPLAVMAQDPSFDCDKAQSGAEEAVCGSSGLASLDVETDRLFTLALNGPNMTDARADELRAYQRGWLKGRNDCWKADDQGDCVRDSYAIRIDELRRDYADARAEDGPSLGPFAYVCDGLDAGVSATFINTDKPLAVLRWGETVHVLPQAISASGARYEAQDGTVFWSKGDDGTLTFEGQDYSCRGDETG